MACHLTCEERDRIAHLCSQGASQLEVARSLQRAPSTISRELRRNQSDGTYRACRAQQLAEARRRERPIEGKMERTEVNASVRDGLAQEWSPAQIAGRLKQQHRDAPERHVSAQTIYTWIDRSPNAKHWKSCLRRRGKRPNRRKKAAQVGAPIAERPTVIETRARLGDFEGDTVLGPPGTGGLATLVCRRSRFTIIEKVRSKESNHVHAKLRDRLKHLPAEQRCSLTFDNGTEFARCHRLEQHLGLDLYFADPGCPYQRGTNENTNGLIRQYFPKGTDFRTISHCQVRRVERLLNHRPRACLGYRTPNEVFLEQSPTRHCD